MRPRQEPRPRRRVAVSRPRPQTPTAVNHVWAYDFVVLTQLVSVHGAPQFLRSDNGPEFVATAILGWPQTAQIETAFIDPGKPWQNGADESFNGKFRDQHLSLQWFRNRADAKVSIEAWRRHFNEVRPHSSLGYLTPAAFKAKHLADGAEGARRRSRLAPT